MCRLLSVTTKKVGLPDTQADAGQSDSYLPLCFAGDTITQDVCDHVNNTTGLIINKCVTGDNKFNAIQTRAPRGTDRSPEYKEHFCYKLDSRVKNETTEQQHFITHALDHCYEFCLLL